MKNREVAEIKKLFTPAGVNMTKIVGMEIDADKEYVRDINRTFLTLDEEVQFKFFDIFKKALSGKIGKNLYNLEIKDRPCGRDLLQEARLGCLKDENVWQVFMELIVENYDYDKRYVIFMTYGAYDIPGKATDGTEMEDASDEVYRYIMTCICPVSLQNPGITFTEEEMKAAERKWVVGMPMTAFLYPAFNDREEDYDHIWFWTKSANEPDEGVITEVLGCKLPNTPKMQKEAFLDMANLKTNSTYKMEEVKEIYHDLQVLALDETGEPITKAQLQAVLGIEDADEETEIMLQNIINLKRFDVIMADASVSVAADRTDLIEERMIDGEEYILVKKNGAVSVNGILLGEENG